MHCRSIWAQSRERPGSGAATFVGTTARTQCTANICSGIQSTSRRWASAGNIPLDRPRIRPGSTRAPERENDVFGEGIVGVALGCWSGSERGAWPERSQSRATSSGPDREGRKGGPGRGRWAPLVLPFPVGHPNGGDRAGSSARRHIFCEPAGVTLRGQAHLLARRKRAIVLVLSRKGGPLWAG